MKGMMLAKISSAGLISMATLVAALWACILGEHLIVQRANREFSQTMNEIHQLQMKRHTIPAALPARAHGVRPSIG